MEVGCCTTRLWPITDYIYVVVNCYGSRSMKGSWHILYRDIESDIQLHNC